LEFPQQPSNSKGTTVETPPYRGPLLVSSSGEEVSCSTLEHGSQTSTYPASHNNPFQHIAVLVHYSLGYMHETWQQ